MNAAVFLDRDNTLIHNDGDLGDPAKVRLIQGAATAVASLCGLGYKIVVVTNQGGVARGKYSEDDVHAVHQRISELIEAGANGARIDRFYYCPYHPKGTVSRYRKEHPNRKPAPGMLREAARDMGLDLSQSWTIGDQVRDIQAGLAAGTRAILLRHDADQLKALDPHDHPGLISDPDTAGAGQTSTPDFYVRNLVEAVRVVAQQRKPEASEQLHRAGPADRRWNAAAVAKLQRKRHKTVDGESSKPDQGDGAATGSAVKEPAVRPFKPWNVPPTGPQDAGEEQVPQAVVPPSPTPPEPTLVAALDEVPEAVEAVEREPRASHADEKTLRLILQELRNQRGMGGEFSYVKIMAMVLATVSGVCLLGAFWMGATDEFIFQRLIAAALVVQLAVISALLWDR